MSNAPQIDPDCTNVPAGWPRPFYRTTSDGKPTAPKYVQWITNTAEDQIFNCDPDRTWTAEKNFLCTSCGLRLTQGLVLDREKLQSLEFEYKLHTEPGSLTAAPVRSTAALDKHDTNYGGALCYRCAVFASRYCPWFRNMHQIIGDDFPWIIVTSATDYREFDESSGIELTRDDLEKTTTGAVKKAIANNELHLADETTEPVIEERPMIEKSSADGVIVYSDETIWNNDEYNNAKD